MIEACHLTKRFGPLTAVDDVSFTVPRGEALALWGPNAAGKTTIIKCLLGLLRCEGRLVIAGRDVRREGKACRRMVGYVPQELAFHGDLRVLEALHFFTRLKRAPKRRPAEVADEVGLAGHGRKRIGELSGGLKQRLALGVALLRDPPALVLDELTSNLDREAQSSFLAMLVRQKQQGRTILFASHRTEEIELLADRVLGLESGRRVFECKPDELAQAAGLRCVLKLVVASGSIDAAVEVLRRANFDVQRNGRGVFVDVAATAKASPLEALSRAGIALADFEIAGQQGVSPGGSRHG